MKTSKITKGSVFAVALSMLSLPMACDDIFEENISDDLVLLVAPSDGVEVDSGSVTFLWELLDGATDYELQVFSPDFQAPANVHADTIVSENSFTTALGVGDYAWGVRALNSAYSTEFSVNNFVVVAGATAPDISESSVVLRSPVDNASIDSGSVVFLWDEVLNASQYRLQLVTPSFEAITSILTDTLTEELNFSTVLDSGQYQWRVQGINTASSTDLGETRTLLVN